MSEKERVVWCEDLPGGCCMSCGEDIEYGFDLAEVSLDEVYPEVPARADRVVCPGLCCSHLRIAEADGYAAIKDVLRKKRMERNND